MAKKTTRRTKKSIHGTQEMSYDTKVIVTVITLIGFYPIGVILMYKWMDWPNWLKILLTLPLIPFVIIPLFVMFGFLGIIV